MSLGHPLLDTSGFLQFHLDSILFENAGGIFLEREPACPVLSKEYVQVEYTSGVCREEGRAVLRETQAAAVGTTLVMD